MTDYLANNITNCIAVLISLVALFKSFRKPKNTITLTNGGERRCIPIASIDYFVPWHTDTKKSLIYVRGIQHLVSESAETIADMIRDAQ